MQMIRIGAIAMGAAAAVAWGHNNPKPEQGAITVCMSQRGNATVFQAQAIASEIFARIGVRLDWKSDKNFACVSGEEIAITLSDETPAGQHPGELAYSIPYQGTRIVVFYD